jgi:O-antigen ligase
VFGRYEIVALVALASFVVWTALSAVWAGNATTPVLSAELGLIYVAFLPALWRTTSQRAALMPLAGVLAAASAVCGYALAGRVVPGRLGSFPPLDGFQLAEPIGYWNGLGILAAMAALVALGLVAHVRAPLGRALAAAPVPVLLTALYLTFSRGAWAALAVGLAAALAVEKRRWRFVATVATAAPTAAIAVFVARHYPALTGATASMDDASAAGKRLALALVVCTVSAAVVSWSVAVDEHRWRVTARTRRALGAAMVAMALLALVSVVARAGGPAALVDDATASFRKPLPQTGGDLNRRLTSLSSNGRTEYWRVAWREVVAHPWLGGGAGSYERYWHRDRNTSYETRNAHNLYLETLAELGPLGLTLLLLALCVPLAALFPARGHPAVPAAIPAYVAFLAHAAIDWDWQIPAVTLAALACGGVVVGLSAPSGAPPVTSGRVRAAAAACLLPLIAFAIVVQVGNGALAKSAAAANRGDAASAERLARRARVWAPWSSQPWQRLGEAQFAVGDARGARQSLRRAIRLNNTDWSLWYGLAQTSVGRAREQALMRAALLNPLSPEIDQFRAAP